MLLDHVTLTLICPALSGTVVNTLSYLPRRASAPPLLLGAVPETAGEEVGPPSEPETAIRGTLKAKRAPPVS